MRAKAKVASHLAMLMVAVAFATSPRDGCANDAGLVGVWRFDEEDGLEARDSGPNSLHGKILRPEEVKRVDGRSGRALLFTGEGKLDACSSVVVPNMKQHDLTQAFTIEAWIRLRPDYTRRDTCFIASNGAFKGPGWRFLISWDSLGLESGDGQSMLGARTSRTDFRFQGSRWYHLAGTYDGFAYRVYVDGIERGVSRPAEPRPMTRGTWPLSIGSYRSGRSNLLKGAIDELRIYARARSPIEVLKDARIK